MEKLSLSGIWKLSENGKVQSYPVRIPGSVLSGLLENDIIEHPYYRENEYPTKDLFWKDYSFERVFVVEEAFLQKEYVDLTANGLDTLTEIYLNGQLVAKTNNMHRSWRFPVKKYLCKGENLICVKCLSPLQYIKDYQPAENKENRSVVPSGGIKGDQYLRKSHSMFGWDWGAQLPDAGIWKDIGLEAYQVTRIEDVRITQHHIEGEVTVRTEILLQKAVQTIQKVPEEMRIHLQIQHPDGGSQTTSGLVNWSSGEPEIKEFTISIPEPRLWWPNGYGEQPLYQLRISLEDDGTIEDEKSFTIGMRTLEVSQEKDSWGSEFAFKVNGVKIFAKGANYIPEDCIYSWITPQRTKELLQSCVWAHFNCIRVWGGGYYPSDDFYELCDAYGLIVWQDLMYACNVYELTDEFEQNIIQETEEVVRRLRHHPSLGLWCGNNEMETGWHHWGDFNQESNYLRMDYVKMFEYILPKAVKKCDSQTFYWPSSPSSGGCFDFPDDESRGDAHYWEVWHGQKPFTDYRKHFFRFCSEFGFQSFPNRKTVETYTTKEDQNIFSKVMESHQKNGSANGKILYYISENFRYPGSFDSLLYVSQILQGIAIKSGVEHWRRNRGRCMGALYWQLNDNWPVASWSSIDYFGRFKTLHYMAERFYAPCAGSLTIDGDKVSVWMQNETLEEIKVTVKLCLKDMQLNNLSEVHFVDTIPPLSVAMLGENEYGDLLQTYGKENLFVQAVYTIEGVRDDLRIQTETDVFVPYKHMNLQKPQIRTRIREEAERFVISLSTDVYAPFVELEFEEKDAIFSENYFSLSNREEKDVLLYKEKIRSIPTKSFLGASSSAKSQRDGFAGAEQLQKELKIRSLRDTY